MTYHIAWEGSFLDFGSLSQINCQLTRQLELDPSLTLSRVSQHPASPAAQHCPEFRYLAQHIQPTAHHNTAITIRHQWPPNWSRPATGKLVIIQPWEFGILPAWWVAASKQVDEFWVPSHYVRQVYQDSGISGEKVYVIPNGIDPLRYHPQAAPLPLPTQKKHRFLFVGGTIGRKGPDILLRAYLQAFTAQDDVCLVIKDFGGASCYQGQTFEEQIRSVQAIPGTPEILYINEEILPEQMPGLYTACHCLVHPYRGEGFGMPILEAMACGLPVIVTQGGAADDFVSEDTGWFIRADRRNIGRQVGEWALVQDGWMLEPDVADLILKLQYSATHSTETTLKGQSGAAIARKSYTWHQIAKTVAARLEELTN